MTFAIAAHSRLLRAEFVSVRREDDSSLAGCLGWPAAKWIALVCVVMLGRRKCAYRVFGCLSSDFLADCQGSKVLTKRSGAGQDQAQEHTRARRRACLDCQSTASGTDNCLACLADSGAAVDLA